MSKLKKLPAMIHVRIERPDGSDPYLVASENGIYGVLDSDGPELIGEYTLVKLVKAERVVKWNEQR